MKPTLVVMAAGTASRYGGLKQVQAVGPAGETIIDYSIFDALRAGFGTVVFVIRREIEDVFRQTVGDRFAARATVRYAFQEAAGRAKPWGTGHAVLVAAPHVSARFAVINGDDFYGAESFQLLADHLRRATSEHAIVGYPLGQTLSAHGAVKRAVCDVDDRGLLRRLNETTVDHALAQSLPAGTLVSMNMMGFTPAIFPHLERSFADFATEHAGDAQAEFLLPTALEALVAGGRARVRVLATPARWFGMTYRDDTETVRRGIAELVAGGHYPLPLPN